MKRFTLLTIALVVLGLAAFPVRPWAQGQGTGRPAAIQQDEHHPQTAQKPDLVAQERQVMDMHQNMMAAMKAQDATLQGLVTKMDAAKGQAKVDAMATLLKAVVQQRTSMHDDMMNMQAMMMTHMMAHMSGGMSPDVKQAMDACPMMKMMAQMGGIK